MNKKQKTQIKQIIFTGISMIIGLIFLKYLPMYFFGQNILFDASLHIIGTIFILYIVYFFIDQNKKWRTPFFIISTGILIILSIQRIIALKHNEIGILLGFLISIISIMIPRWKEIRKKLIF